MVVHTHDPSAELEYLRIYLEPNSYTCASTWSGHTTACEAWRGYVFLILPRGRFHSY